MNQKKFLSATGLLTVLLISAASLFAWFTPVKAASTDEISRVSVILPHENDGYWELIQDGIDQILPDYAQECGIDVLTMVPQLNYNVEQMEDLVRQQIAAQVDFLVVQGNEDEEFLSILADAAENGIQVIFMDTDVKEFSEHLYIGTDNYEAGRLLGSKLAELTDGQAKVAVVSGEENYLNMEQRLDGFRDVLSDYPDIVVSDPYYDHYDGFTAMQLFQNLDEEYDVIVFLEGTGGTTLSEAIRSTTDYQYVLGFDAYENIQSGVMDGIVKQDTEQIGEQVIEEIAYYIENGTYSQNQIHTEIQWVDSDTYDEVIG